MMAENRDLAIRVDCVGKSFQTFDRPGRRFMHALLGGRSNFHREFHALQDISIDIRKGEVLGVIGRNGCGKSTLLQVIAGTLMPTSGSVSQYGRIAALLELGTGFDPEETGRENIIFTARLLGLSSDDLMGNLDSIVQFADIGEFIDQPVKTYSSGMVVRLAFAITAHVEAEIIIVDEALAVGDAEFQFKCLSRLDSLLENGATVVLVSHDLQLIKAYCNRVVYLKGGRVEFDGDCEIGCELYQRDSTVRKGPANIGFHEKGLAFGSGRGRIRFATLRGDGAERGYFISGERVYLDVGAQFLEHVQRPRITMVLRDIRGYNLYAINNQQLDFDLLVDGDNIVRARFSFVADLQDGDYGITLRLDDMVSDSAYELLDKQVGIITFRVDSPRKRFDAVVNLHGTVEAPPA